MPALDKNTRKRVVLIGMPGVGKSTVGVVLAKRTGLMFVDSDLVIQERTGRRLSDLIAERGTEGFLALEEEINLSLRGNGCVIATGGSAVYGSRAMKQFTESAVVIYLRMSCEEIEQRLGSLEERGVVIGKGQTLRSLFEERTPLYEKYADLTVECGGRDIREIVEAICAAVSEGGGGYE